MIATPALWQSWRAMVQEGTHEDIAHGIGWLTERGFLDTSQAGEATHVCLTELGDELTSQYTAT